MAQRMCQSSVAEPSLSSMAFSIPPLIEAFDQTSESHFMDPSEDAFVFPGTADDLNANELGSDTMQVMLTM
ncbi:hypothetical protein PGIGA_G00110100 [Pangasianodon gigas]|uniref:Uncharacterized protein n=1 Tax=Pangasianodon gigas TaxID=30993 RepID=A0ACC5W9H3_PANGG|nr:hypothetical protein [Pangasianodon gigas]